MIAPKRALYASMLFLIGCASIVKNDSTPRDTTETHVVSRVDGAGRRASVLSAFFGLDVLPPRANFLCSSARGKDGMPVIFSHEVDIDTVQAGDFKVVSADGSLGSNHCVTAAPADQTGEIRTILLVGEYGGESNPPVRVEIQGNLLSLDRALNFKGESVKVTPLREGPTIVMAENVPQVQWDSAKRSTSGRGCPKGTKQVVRVVWAGGVTKPGGDEVDQKEVALYRVTLLNRESKASAVSPVAISDLGDNDNNHELCIAEEGTPKSIFFPAGYLTDPRQDLNPDTRAQIK